MVPLPSPEWALRSLNLNRGKSDAPSSQETPALPPTTKEEEPRCGAHPFGKITAVRSQISDLNPWNSGEVLAIIGKNLCESLLFHGESVVRVHEIDVCVAIEIKSDKEKRAFGQCRLGVFRIFSTFAAMSGFSSL